MLCHNIFLALVDRHRDQISQNFRTQPEAKYIDFTIYLDDQLRYAQYPPSKEGARRNIFLALFERHCD